MPVEGTAPIVEDLRCLVGLVRKAGLSRIRFTTVPWSLGQQPGRCRRVQGAQVHATNIAKRATPSSNIRHAFGMSLSAYLDLSTPWHFRQINAKDCKRKSLRSILEVVSPSREHIRPSILRCASLAWRAWLTATAAAVIACQAQTQRHGWRPWMDSQW